MIYCDINSIPSSSSSCRPGALRFFRFNVFSRKFELYNIITNHHHHHHYHRISLPSAKGCRQTAVSSPSPLAYLYSLPQLQRLLHRRQYGLDCDDHHHHHCHHLYFEVANHVRFRAHSRLSVVSRPFENAIGHTSWVWRGLGKR